MGPSIFINKYEEPGVAPRIFRHRGLILPTGASMFRQGTIAPSNLFLIIIIITLFTVGKEIL